MNTLLISLLTLVVSLLTQVNNPNVATSTQAQAFTLANSVLEYVNSVEASSTALTMAPEQTQKTQVIQIQQTNHTPDIASSDTPQEPVNNTTQATTTQQTLPGPNFVGTPQETFTQDPNDNAVIKTFSWETDIPTTAEFDLCTGVGEATCVPQTMFTTASTTGTFSIERPLTVAEKYQVIVTANGQSQTFVWNR